MGWIIDAFKELKMKKKDKVKKEEPIREEPKKQELPQPPLPPENIKVEFVKPEFSKDYVPPEKEDYTVEERLDIFEETLRVILDDMNQRIGTCERLLLRMVK